MNSISEVFDGWVHYFVPGEEFTVPASSMIEYQIDLLEERQPYESPTPQDVREKKNPGRYPAGALPFQEEQAAWAGVALALRSLSVIIGGSARCYQENQYEQKTTKLLQPQYTFQFVPGEDGFQEGRL